MIDGPKVMCDTCDKYGFDPEHPVMEETKIKTYCTLRKRPMSPNAKCSRWMEIKNESDSNSGQTQQGCVCSSEGQEGI